MKALLVIDMPKDCRRCQLMVDRFCYGIPADEVHDSININERPKWCPLRPLPQFEEEAVPYQVSETEVDCYQDPYATGWNDCLEAITGETE